MVGIQQFGPFVKSDIPFYITKTSGGKNVAVPFLLDIFFFNQLIRHIDYSADDIFGIFRVKFRLWAENFVERLDGKAELY